MRGEICPICGKYTKIGESLATIKKGWRHECDSQLLNRIDNQMKTERKSRERHRSYDERLLDGFLLMGEEDGFYS